MGAAAAPLQTIEVATGDRADASVIVLHGLGADGTDFLAFADEIDLAAVGRVRWVLPRAPVRPVTINGGYPMRAWYDILGLEGARREDEAGLRMSMAQVLALVEREIARGVPARRIVLAGFSQGCAMTLLAGLRCPHRLAGLAGLSGYLPLAASTAAEAHAANRDVPLFLAHGSRDEVVVPDRGRSSRDQLQALGYTIEWHEYPMEHSVCIEEVRALQAFLQRVLAA
ncbi:MAG: carboxylesterase [Rubrivivax sp.]